MPRVHDNTITLPLSEVVVFDNPELLYLLHQEAVVRIVEEDEEAKVVGVIEAFTIINGGIAIKIVGSDDPIPVSADQLGDVTVTVNNNGLF